MSYINLNKLKEMVEAEHVEYIFCIDNFDITIERVEIVDLKSGLLNLTVSSCDGYETITVPGDELKDRILILKDVTEKMSEILA